MRVPAPCATAGSAVRNQFVPTLRPGDVVVVDNLVAHKVAGVREAIESVGANVASLPPPSSGVHPLLHTLRMPKRCYDGMRSSLIEGQRV